MAQRVMTLPEHIAHTIHGTCRSKGSHIWSAHLPLARVIVDAITPGIDAAVIKKADELTVNRLQATKDAHLREIADLHKQLAAERQRNESLIDAWLKDHGVSYV